MSKDITATRKEFGSGQFNQVILRVPDKVGECFKDCALQIVDYPNKDTVIFLCRDGVDINSVTFKAINNNSYSDAVKKLYERVIEEQ